VKVVCATGGAFCCKGGSPSFGQAIIGASAGFSGGKYRARCRHAGLLQRLNGKQVRVRATPCLCCPRNGQRVWACRNATGREPGKATCQDLRARIPAFAHHWTDVPRGSGHRTLGARACAFVVLPHAIPRLWLAGLRGRLSATGRNPSCIQIQPRAATAATLAFNCRCLVLDLAAFRRRPATRSDCRHGDPPGNPYQRVDE
jgi:hypothetical protein